MTFCINEDIPAGGEHFPKPPCLGDTLLEGLWSGFWGLVFSLEPKGSQKDSSPAAARPPGLPEPVKSGSGRAPRAGLSQEAEPRPGGSFHVERTGHFWWSREKTFHVQSGCHLGHGSLVTTPPRPSHLSSGPCHTGKQPQETEHLGNNTPGRKGKKPS